MGRVVVIRRAAPQGFAVSKGINWSRADRRETEPAFPEYDRPQLYDPVYVKRMSGPVRHLTRAEIAALHLRPPSRKRRKPTFPAR